MSSNSNRYKRISNNKFINKEIITNNKQEKNSPNHSKPRTKITINKSLLWKEKEKDKEENKNKNNINNINKNSKINLIKNISLSKLKNDSIETSNNTKISNKINDNNKLLLDNKIDSYQKKYTKLNLTDRKKENLRSPNSEDNQKSEQNNKYTPTTQSTQKENNNFSAREFKHTSYRFLLHHASKNLNNTFSKIYNPNNRSFSNSLNKSINSNNNDNNQLNHFGYNKSSADIFENNNKNIFKDKQELNRIAFNQNNLIKSQSNNNFNKFKKRMAGNISLRNFSTENNNEILNDSFNSQNNNLIYDNYNKNLNINQYNTNDHSFSNNNNMNMNNSSSNFYHNYLDNNNHQRVFSFLNNNKINNNNNNKYFLFNNNLKEKYYTENQNLLINLENLLILQNKLDLILNKLNEYTPCSDEVYEWIKYYFENSFYDNLIMFFKDSNNRNIFINFIKIELLCYCLCYETSVDLNLNKVCIVLKSIFNLIHFNYLIIIRFVLHNTQMTSENYVWYEKLFNIVKSNLQINLNKNELDEFNIIKILNYNIKGILDYYKMIIDNLYIINYHSEIRQFSFPYCLSFQNLKNTKKKELISSFFFEGYKNLDNYDIKDIHIFFNQILNENNEVSPIISFKIKFNEDINNNNNNINNYSYRKNNNNNKEYYNYNDYDEKNINENMCCYSERLYNTNNKNVNISSYEEDNNNEINYNIININYKNISDDNNNDNKYIYNRRNNNSILNNINNNNNIYNYTTKISLKYLPNLNVRLYKYTLCLELDNTLVYILNENGSNSMILRPNLYEFLKKMKKIYELVLFSFGSPEYVDPIVNAIEKNEKYFEHRLYKQHCVLYGNEYVKDLSKIGRDLKKTLIVDILSKNFRLQIDNGICMKAFYGDCRKDKNTLKLLSNVLEDIKYDADKTNDIRLSLKKKENFIISKIGY